MRSRIFMMSLAVAIVLGACGNDQAAIEESRKLAEKDQKAAASDPTAAKAVSPPVPGHGHVPCTTLLDPALVQQSLGEKDPVTIVESKQEPDAAGSCSIMRGGKRPTEAEQKSQLKTVGRLGVMNGDEICRISAFCWTLEDADKFREKCKADKTLHLDESMGFPACIQIVATGVDDVKSYKLFDDDTKCILQVHAGPSNVDNDLIGKCAKAAHDLIGPDQIKPGPKT
jgi:hypothetical protein